MTWPDTADSSDHEGAAKAIAQGLAKGHSAENPSYWLHISGTGVSLSLPIIGFVAMNIKQSKPRERIEIVQI